MRSEEEKLMLAFKRLIHLLTTGKRSPHQFGNTSLYRAEVHILEIIGKRPGISGSDIVKDMKVTKGAVSQIISKLSKKGLLEKSRSADDMKVQELNLTKKGVEALFHHSEHEKILVQKARSELTKCSVEDIGAFTTIVTLVADFVETPPHQHLHDDQ
jgi:DNA-binding MarR family transcriptional regulator